MNNKISFYDDIEVNLNKEFTKNGYVISNNYSQELLDLMRNQIIKLACEYLEIDKVKDKFLENIHEYIKVENLNEFRLYIFKNLNALDWVRPAYYRVGKVTLDNLVGNELAMQNFVNLSIQLPGDKSSLLDIHSDLTSGESPFQVVQWIPLVNTYETNAMFIYDPIKSKQILDGMSGSANMNAVFNRVKNELIWLKMDYGQTLIFNTGCLHGNVVNETPVTRWSLNCRFKGIFTPHMSVEKNLGFFYQPITAKTISRIGVSYIND